MRWVTSGELDVPGRCRIDTLTAVMLVVVTTVSALVHLYSIGYMHEDASYPRFFAYLSLFTFAMLALVTGGNLLQMFFGWEGVGLCVLSAHRLLVREARGQRGAIKAFVVNRVGDVGFLLGIFALFFVDRSSIISTRCFAAAPERGRQDDVDLRTATVVS